MRYSILALLFSIQLVACVTPKAADHSTVSLDPTQEEWRDLSDGMLQELKQSYGRYAFEMIDEANCAACVAEVTDAAVGEYVHQSLKKVYTTKAAARAIIIDAEEVFHLALPDGRFLVSRGALQAARNGTEIAAIAAHDLALTRSREHKASSRAAIANKSPKVVVELWLRRGFSVASLLEADVAALNHLQQAGLNPRAWQEYLARLLTLGDRSMMKFYRLGQVPLDRRVDYIGRWLKQNKKDFPSPKEDPRLLKLWQR